MTRKEILAAAENCVCKDRQNQHGRPEHSFQKIADHWSAYLDKEITQTDVANMMILLKVARSETGKPNPDNWVDICGYAACGGEIEGRLLE